MHSSSLDFDQNTFNALLEKNIKLVLHQFENLEQKKAYHYHAQSTVASWFDEPLPEKGIHPEQVLDLVKEKVLNTATGNLGPHMYAYVMSGGNQMAILSDQLSACINQNLGKWHLSPSLTEIERKVAQWGAQIINYSDSAAGILVSGGSAANLAGLTIARNLFFEEQNIRKKGIWGLPPFLVYASEEVHGCVDKSVELLGIGTEQLRKIKTNPDFSINTKALIQQIEKDRDQGLLPFCLIGTAGTVNTGVIDDLETLGEIAQKYKMWFHIDGAYGVLAASLPSLAPKYKGLEMADSVALDFHKWMYQPFEAGCILVKNWKTLRSAYFKKADYLDTAFEDDKGRIDLNEHHFLLSRNTKALKVWMSIKAYGMERIRAMIQKDIDLSDYLADRVEEAPDFVLNARSDLAVTCFQYKADYVREEDIVSLNQALIPALEADGRVFITGTKLNGLFVLRACLINHRKQRASIDYLIQVIREVGQRIIKTKH